MNIILLKKHITMYMITGVPKKISDFVIATFGFIVQYIILLYVRISLTSKS